MTDTQVKVTPTIDAIVTFHSEGIVAHRTLLGLNRLRDHAAKAGIRVKSLLSGQRRWRYPGDRNQQPTARKRDQIIEVSNGEAGLSRNDGIRASRSDYVGIFDGDDYYSANWLTEALATSCSRSGNVIVHPEYQISFGTIHCIARSIDMDETPDYPLANCLTVNPWGCAPLDAGNSICSVLITRLNSRKKALDSKTGTGIWKSCPKGCAT
jgi:glycosyltransferase involved in cell wall biosynthesis